MVPSDLAVEHHSAQLGRLRVHYVERGEGPLVVLLHGFPDTWWTWRYQIEPLVWAGYRVVAPDLRGYGDSEARAPYDLNTLADDLAALLDHLGVERARVVGHDWGGAVAWHFAAVHPARCERLAVLNCPHPMVFQRVAWRSPRQLARSWYMFFFLVPGVPERSLTRDGGRRLRAVWRANAVDPRHFTNDEVAPMVEPALRPGAMRAMLGIYRENIGGAPRHVRAMNALYRTPLATPTLLVWATDDKALGYDDLVPPTYRWVRDLSVRPIERCGHFVQAERPDEVNRALVDFFDVHAEAARAGG